jgi:hypothetical protein
METGGIEHCELIEVEMRLLEDGATPRVDYLITWRIRKQRNSIIGRIAECSGGEVYFRFEHRRRFFMPKKN